MGCYSDIVNITSKQIRRKGQANIQKALFNKLFSRYSFKFNGDDEESEYLMKRVKHNALRMMTKALNTWWNMANSMKGEDF